MPILVEELLSAYQLESPTHVRSWRIRASCVGAITATGSLVMEVVQRGTSQQAYHWVMRECMKSPPGSYHTCAIMADRSLRCWGDNWHGQLGDGSFSDKLSPVDIEIPSNSSAVTVDSGAFHSCVGMNDGSMYCWGYNSYGQLGNGGTTRAGIPMPVPLDSTQSPTDIQVGLFHSCALFDSGEMSCWGDNAYGQIGDGTPISGGWHLPKTLVLNHEVLSISVGHRHSCAILTDASLQCWGINSKGQVGDGTTTNRHSPTVIDLGHGSKEQLPCSPGTYQPNSSQTSCILADRGFSVPNSGELGQDGCTRGTYSSLKGQATCTLASLGFYVSEFEAVTQTACPDGQSTLNLGSTNFDNCMNDFDGDKIPDQFDSDADNDGVPNTQDFDWLDPNISADSDGDNIPDSMDLDDDNDGFNDTEDAFPNNQAEWKDGDGDGIGDNTDNDDDGDGRSDWFDVFPDNPEEWSDFDGDTFGDNADPTTTMTDCAMIQRIPMKAALLIWMVMDCQTVSHFPMEMHFLLMSTIGMIPMETA